MATPGMPQGLSPNFGSLVSPLLSNTQDFEWEYRKDGSSGDEQSKARLYLYRVSTLDDEVNYTQVKTYDLAGNGDRIKMADWGYSFQEEQEYSFRVRTWSKKGVQSDASDHARFIYGNVVQSAPLTFNGHFKRNDQVMRTTYFSEIRQALIELLEDYTDAGMEDEEAYIELAYNLFTGDFVPMKRDFQDVESILRFISTVKEQGEAYTKFVSDVEGGLGVGDMERVIAYIETLQNLGPRAPQIDLRTDAADMYQITALGASYQDATKRALVVSWSLGDINPADGWFEILPSKSEDVSYYRAELHMGVPTATSQGRITTSVMTYRPEDLSAAGFRISFKIPWDELFTATTITKAYVELRVAAIDKRGNQSEFAVQRNVKNPKALTPLGLKQYELEYKLNSGSWKALAKQVDDEYVHRLSPGSGKMYYRVRAADKTTNLFSKWYEKGPIKFTSPYPPGAPDPSLVLGIRNIGVVWKEAAHADYYQVWVGNESDAKRKKQWFVVDDTSKTGESFRKTFSDLDPKTKYTFYVRAVNIIGSKTGSVTGTTKSPEPKTKTYRTSNKVANWHTSYKVDPRSGKDYTVPKGWSNNYAENVVIQGEWREPFTGWHSGGKYWAKIDQKWGRHRGCWFMDYEQIAKDLKGKRITKAIFRGRRMGSIHGYKEDAQPVYMWNHNSKWKPKGNDPAPTLTNKKTFQAKIDRGQNFVLSGKDMISLVQKIANGDAKGVALYKDYGDNATPRADRAYMVIDDSMSIEVEYYDE